VEEDLVLTNGFSDIELLKAGLEAFGEVKIHARSNLRPTQNKY
jgi:hypothetical protein